MSAKINRPRGAYFFIDKRLHRILVINSPANLVEAWSYEDHGKVTMLNSDYRALAKRAVGTKDAADIMNLSAKTLRRAWKYERIREPATSYPILTQKQKIRIHWWGLHNLLELHDYLLTVHIGRPRHDGEVYPNQNLPTRAEIIARMTNQSILYAKGSGETYVPVFRPPTF